MIRLQNILFNVFCLPFLLISFCLFALLTWLNDRWHGVGEDR